jgi:endoglycosylceramidase
VVKWRRTWPRRRGERERGPRTLVALALGVLASLLWLEMPVSALTTTVGSPSRPAAQWSLPWLSTRGSHVVDSDGRVVLLRGFNTSTLLEPTVLRSPLDDVDATMMESDGFDVVRLAISWGRLEPERGRWDTAYLDTIVRTVAMLNAHHLYVVLDMHFLDWSSKFGGSGAPDWASLPLAPDLHIAQLGDWQRHLSPAANGAYVYFWLSPDWQGDFMRTWQLVASRFVDDSGVAGYDLFNEPHAIPLPPIRFEKDFLFPLYARTIDALGEVDANHLFIVEGQLLADFGTTIVPIHAPNLVYSPHEYTGSLVPPTFDGNAQALDSHVRQVAGEATRLPGALWIGEWGMASSQAQSGGWIDDAVTAFTAVGAGWAWWQWREDSAWGVRNTAGVTNTVMLARLAQPYLAAAPAAVTVSAVGGAGQVTLRVGTGYTGAAIELAWPALGDGPPRVTSTCAALTQFDPATSRLTITAPAATACVITVT